MSTSRRGPGRGGVYMRQNLRSRIRFRLALALRLQNRGRICGTLWYIDISYFVQVKKMRTISHTFTYAHVHVQTLCLLEMVRLYWPMGSATAPETADPRTSPTPQAQATIAIPNAWLLSSDASEMTAFAVPITPAEICTTRARDRKTASS